MSDPGIEPSPPRSGQGGGGALTVLLILVGIVLLLPGLCSLAAIVILSAIDLKGVLSDPSLMLLWLVCIGVSIGGILLIRHAARRPS